jgi:hypothetical protein
MGLSHRSLFSLGNLVSIALIVAQFGLQVLGLPLSTADDGSSQTTMLSSNDPLKDFVSSVTNNGSKPLQRRYVLRVNDVDDVYLHLANGQGISNEAQHRHQFEEEIHLRSAIERPSWFASALMARRLLALSKNGAVSTVYPASSSSNGLRVPPTVAGLSISLPEYIADCEESLPDGNGGEGNPTFLGLYVSTTFQNIAAGSNISLMVDWWDHLNQTSPLYPDFPLSAAGLPRLSLIGYMTRFATPLSTQTRTALESCFLASHPDAAAWLPGNSQSPHGSFWAKMVVIGAYWIGGFGDTQRIGWLNMTEWTGIRRQRSLPGIGDESGWEDVRLPGEQDS